MDTLSFPVIIEQDKDGYVAWCPQLPGCMTQGNSYEEAKKNIEDAIVLYLESMEETPSPSDDVSMTMVTVALTPTHAKAAKTHRR